MVSLREELLAREDELVGGQLRIDLLQLLLGTDDGRDEVDPRSHLRGDLWSVVEVDPPLGVRLVERTDRNQQVVRPQDEARLGDDQLELGAVDL